MDSEHDEIELVSAPEKPKAKRTTRPSSRANGRHQVDSGTEARTIRDADNDSPPPAAPTKKRTQTARKTTVGSSNSSRLIGKGKAKADPPTAKKSVITVDGNSNDEEDPVLASNVKQKRAGTADTSSTRLTRELEDLKKENDRLTRLASKLEGERDNYTKQLDEVFLIRSTEAENLLVSTREEYEDRIKTQDELIDALRTELNRVEPLSRTGRILHLITRETADREKRTLEQQMDALKEEDAKKDQQLKQKDTIIDELRESERLLRIELNGERNRAIQSGPTKPSSSTTARSRDANGTSGSLAEAAKRVETIKFYENATNLLVVNLRIVPYEHNEKLDVRTFTCMYTDDSSKPSKSLSFSLTFGYELQQDGSVMELISYVPRDMDKETPEFRKKLDFLAEEFTFGLEQLPIFYKNMRDYMSIESESPTPSQKMVVDVDLVDD